MSIWNRAKNAQAASHQACGSQWTSERKGMNSRASRTRETAVDLARSASQSRGVIVLKPYFFSMTKVPQRLKGMSSRTLAP